MNVQATVTCDSAADLYVVPPDGVHWSPGSPAANIYDDDWATLASPVGINTSNATVLANYTLAPNFVMNGSYWTVKDADATVDLKLNTSYCSNTTTLELRMIGHYTGPADYYAEWSCKNGTNWYALRNTNGLPGNNNVLYEETACLNNTAAASTTGLQPCGTTAGLTQSRQLSTFNERNFTVLNASVQGYIHLSSDPLGAEVNTTTNFTYSNTTYWLCLNSPTLNYTVDGQLRYTSNNSGTYRIRDFFLDNVTFDNASASMPLYMIPSDEGTLVTLHIRDQFGSPYTGVTVKVQRWYPEINAYKTVAIPMTDDQGDAAVYLALYDVYYRFVVVNDGLTVYTSPAGLLSSAERTITVSPDVIIEWVKYYGQVGGSCNYNNVTYRLTCGYTDLTGDLTSAVLGVSKLGALSVTSLCTNTSTTAGSGFVSCDLGNQTGYTMGYRFYLNLDPDVVFEIASGVISPGSETSKLLGTCNSLSGIASCREGLFITMILVLVAVLLGSQSPAVGITFGLAAVAGLWWIGLVAISFQALATFFLLGGIVIFVTREGSR